ncbi:MULTISPECIES: hypothetical protein [Corallococcus]|uniref:hypothetical protein n=1 Tax=Corallococcus TaxID=83461 RepID=UPI00163D5848|nr:MULTISPECIES: hypothetical protein [Corallococcus]
MHRTLVALPFGLCVLSLTACPGKAPPRVETPSSAPPAIHVPAGCEKDQSGDYRHAQNPAFRYLGQDDGGTLSLAVVRAWADGGVESPDAGSVGIILHRTPDGFVGETRATGFTASGTPCPVSFPTEAVACTDAGITLRAASSTSIDEGCRSATSGPAPVRQEQVLLRGAPDAGR